MQLNTRQARIFKLANLLGTGKPVSAADIITSLECSEPTLTRALKELRESDTRKGGKSCSGWLWAYVSGERVSVNGAPY